MKRFITPFFCLLLVLTLPGRVFAQQLVSGFRQGQGHSSVFLSYTRERYDEFYLGKTKTDIAMAGQEPVVTESANLYAAYGLTDKLDLIANLPYISSKSRQLSDNQKILERDLQNATVALAYRALQTEGEAGVFSATGALALSTPLSRYRTNIINAIGNRATQLDPSLLLQYKFVNGLFVNGQGGYSLRTNDVPDAVLLGAKVGYAAPRFFLESWVSNQTSTSGIDIGGPGFTPDRFPETKVNTTSLGASLYVPVVNHLGVTVGGGTRLAGRNAAAVSWYSAGLGLSL
ncbi:hypothetical protein SAMN00120144_3364 [Hymenobacter roseosalivarius DSM 11622]|uniref:Transporter n=1 Tax=Hymenobacter roseosalivarius DSM 11622 TaxID=645990 RepID=A0A1W1UJP3_9BACT|nr:hypothetical protein [Hymenobacter roseosalivarius]SMB81316.1 hypothetical protein SAMN00120144_3364 [Hymenobacter roseosalivarius DSM 11622]